MATQKKFRFLFVACIALVVGCLVLCALIGKGLVFQNAGSRATALAVVILFLGMLICATLLTGLMNVAPSEKVESPRLQLGLPDWPRVQQGSNLLESPGRESWPAYGLTESNKTAARALRLAHHNDAPHRGGSTGAPRPSLISVVTKPVDTAIAEFHEHRGHGSRQEVEAGPKK